MDVSVLAVVVAQPENAADPGVTTADWLGMAFMGVLVTVLWLAFRRLKHLADEPPKKTDEKK